MVSCFLIDPNFDCWNPRIVAITYEEINYAYSYKWLDIAYGNQSNTITKNPDRCGTADACDVFKNCSVNPLNELIWTDIHPFFFITNVKFY